MFNNEDKFQVLQIEVTTRCNAFCVMCPRSVFRGEWIFRDMSMKLFTKIIDDINHDLELIYLQGWGEPLLHPNIVDMVSYVKGKLRTNVGLTTNAVFLSDALVERLLRAGLDSIAISIGGATEKTHNSVRVNCDFNTILKNVRCLIELRKTLGSSVRVIASYLMMKQNVCELPDFIRLCNSLGMDEIVINNLTYIPSKALYDCKVFSCYGEKLDKNVKRCIDEAKRVANELGQKVFIYNIECVELANCPEEPTRTMFINVNGDISPCVYANVPVQGNKMPRFFINRQLVIDKVVFGNAGVNNLYDVWNSDKYVEFRKIFEERLKTIKNLSLMLLPEVLEEITIARIL